MKREEATEYVVKELGKHSDRNEIIRSLCERTGAAWSQVEEFVQQVEAEHGQTIAARQSPFLIALGIAISLGGLGLILSGIQYFLSFVQGSTLSMILGAPSAFYRIGAFITGLAMLVGGLIGLRQPILALIESLDRS